MFLNYHAIKKNKSSFSFFVVKKTMFLLFYMWKTIVWSSCFPRWIAVTECRVTFIATVFCFEFGLYIWRRTKEEKKNQPNPYNHVRRSSSELFHQWKNGGRFLCGNISLFFAQIKDRIMSLFYDQHLIPFLFGKKKL